MGIRRFARRLSAVGFFILFGASLAQAACRDDTVRLRGDFGEARFTVAVADTGAERSRGLMFVEQMPQAQGMLFVYPRVIPSIAFWMKNTLIPLDMIFIDPEGVVTRVHSNAIPGDTTAIPGGEGVQYVLEINGGLAGAMGIVPGTQLQHPAINQAISAWPCDAL